MPKEHLCYTDGSCKPGKDSPGGWGVFIRPPAGEPIEAYGSEKPTLSKRMEYRAVAEALVRLPIGATATLFSDNQSLVESLNRKLRDWVASDFRNVDEAIVESVRTIAESIRMNALTVKWQWVKAHNGNAGNERADALAAQGAREAKAR